jgi:hypothetical protein
MASTKDKKRYSGRFYNIAPAKNAPYCLKKGCQKSVKPIHAATVDVDSNKEMQ